MTTRNGKVIPIRQPGELYPGALRDALADLERRYGPDTMTTAGQLRAVEVVPSGYPALDQALGIGGFPRGRIADIYGPHSSGKTTLCLRIIGQAQKAGGQAAFIDTEHALSPAWAVRQGVDPARLLVSRPRTGEQVVEIVETLIGSGALAVVVVDSAAALLPRAEADSESGDNHAGLAEFLTDQALRKLCGLASRTNTLLVFTNQMRQKPGVMFGNPEAPTGGEALRYYASVAIDLRRLVAIKERGEIAGSQVRAIVKKNKLAGPFKTAEFEIRWRPEGVR